MKLVEATEHYKLMIGKSTTPEEADFLEKLTLFLSAIANNKVPVEVAPLLNNIEGLVIPK